MQNMSSSGMAGKVLYLVLFIVAYIQAYSEFLCMGFEQQRLDIFLSTTASRPVLGPTQPPIQWVPGVLSLGVKRPGRETDHLPPSSAEIKNVWSFTSTPPICLHGMGLS
jgi:hypothetical protein